MTCDPSIYTMDQSDFMVLLLKCRKKKNKLTVSNSLTGDQAEHFLWPDGGQNC